MSGETPHPGNPPPSGKPVVLFVSHRNKQCGVHHFGKRTGQALRESTLYDFIYIEVETPREYIAAVGSHSPVAIVWNYHPATMPWVDAGLIRRKRIPNIGIYHEISQENAAHAGPELFDCHVAADPTLVLANPYLFKVGRFVADHPAPPPAPSIPTIGSFGFGIDGKGFERLIALVQSEFERAIIRLHIPHSFYFDRGGEQAQRIARQCEALLWKPGITCQITHEFLDDDGLLNFLAGNSINAFLYDQYRNRGISSVLDFALAVDRPLAISRSEMFRHLYECRPSVCIEDRSLRAILESGVAPLKHLRREWCRQNLIWDYERVISQVLSEPLHHFRPKARPGGRLEKLARHLGRGAARRYRKWVYPRRGSPWVGDRALSNPNWIPAQHSDYKPIELPSDEPLNRILDERARRLYAPAIAQLFLLATEVMSRKIPEANIQQAFVFDTALRHVRGCQSPRLLCVGAYEDSAAMALRRLGWVVEEVDPVLNYDLETFCTKPTTEPGTYDAVFATSVIEHVNDDEAFVRQIATLLAPRGRAVLTCDFKEDYRHGDPKPSEDVRLYTSSDLSRRLPGAATDCCLVGSPEWAGAMPDFHFGPYVYSFASLVLEKAP